MKKGQITLYVVIAIMLVSAVTIIVYLQREQIKVILSPVPGAVKPVYSEIEGCLKTTAENGIYLIGMQGGYASLPEDAFVTDFSSIAYGYYEGRRTLLSLNEIENELNNYVEMMLPECVDFSKWPELEVLQDSVSAKSKILDRSVRIDVEWPLTFTGTTTYNLKTFSTESDVKLGIIYNITQAIVENEIINPDKVDLGYFSEINEKYNFTVDAIPYNNTMVYALKTQDNILNDKKYIWFFANKFS